MRLRRTAGLCVWQSCVLVAQWNRFLVWRCLSLGVPAPSQPNLNTLGLPPPISPRFSVPNYRQFPSCACARGVKQRRSQNKWENFSLNRKIRFNTDLL